MKRLILYYIGLVCLIVLALPVQSQYTYYKPDEGFGIEISLSNTDLKRMPMYRNSIASLTATGDFIIGGTKAEDRLTPFLFVASLSKRELVSLKDLNEILPGQRSIQSGFFKAKDKSLYAGTISNKLSSGANGNGHLLRVVITSEGVIEVADLGVPVPGEGVYSLTGNDSTQMIYGISYPSGIFFSYAIKTKQFKVYKELAPNEAEINKLRDEFHEKPEDYLSSALIIDNKGMVYGSRPINKLFYFNPADESFTTIANIPEVWGRKTLGKAESWIKSPQGVLYGGNAGDGQLFQIDPDTRKVRNLGKPVMMPRLRGLSFGADGKIYGLAGALPGYVHLFSYDVTGEGFTDLGNPQFILKAPGIEQGIEWRGFQLQTIVASEDGKFIIMGEDEALSQLLVFPVGN